MISRICQRVHPDQSVLITGQLGCVARVNVLVVRETLRQRGCAERTLVRELLKIKGGESSSRIRDRPVSHGAVLLRERGGSKNLVMAKDNGRFLPYVSLRLLLGNLFS